MGVLIHLALWWEELQKVRILDQPVCGCNEAYNCSFKPGSGLRQKMKMKFWGCGFYSGFSVFPYC